MISPVLRQTLLAAGILLGSHAALAENRVALVIGQSNYKSVVALPNPANDAKAVSQMLTESGFEVLSAADLSQNEMRTKVGDFAAKVAEKGPDTVALVFYGGHGLQIDGENYLVPVDVDPKRETDIPLQAVRLNDILNTLTSVPSKTRILLLDSCRNNPFPEINKTAARGLAIVDAKTGVPGTFMSFSTSPGAEAEDGSGANSPYTTALLAAAKEPGLSIEDTFKRVRVSVNKATEGRQTPWDSSSLTEDFRFVGLAVAGPKLASVKKTVDEWKRDLKGKPVEAANELIVTDGSDESYEAFAALYAQTPQGLQARDWLDRHRRMVAWKDAVFVNNSAGYRAFIAQYPDSDLVPTARKLEERLRNRPNFAPVAAVSAVAPVQNASLAAPTCPCNTQPAPQQKKVDAPVKRVDPNPPKRVDRRLPRRVYEPDDDVVVVRRAPPQVYEPGGPPIGVGIGIGIGGGGYGGGGYGGGGMHGGAPVGQSRSRGGY
jgi:hypothetical protein